MAFKSYGHVFVILSWMIFREKLSSLGKPCPTKSAVFLTLFKRGGGGPFPCSKIYVANYVKFKGPFGSINLDIERSFKVRNVPNEG